MNYRKLKYLSNTMFLANFISTLFYSLSYPYIYAETIKVVPKCYISIEQILTCLSIIVFCKLWNKYSDNLFSHYLTILIAELAADVYLFADVIIRNNLKSYFMLNVIIFAIITRNVCCGITKLRAKVNPTENLRERFDNNLNIVDSAATLIGAGIAMICPFSIKTLFVFALIGNISDNAFYIYIYHKAKGSECASAENNSR